MAKRKRKQPTSTESGCWYRSSKNSVPYVTSRITEIELKNVCDSSALVQSKTGNLYVDMRRLRDIEDPLLRPVLRGRCIRFEKFRDKILPEVYRLLCVRLPHVTPITNDFINIIFRTVGSKTYTISVHSDDEDNEDILKRMYKLESGCLPAMIAKEEGKNEWWVVNGSVEES